MHPWLIQSVQGSQWLEPSDNNYNEAYQAFGSDIALLEIASDTYQNPVESTPTWGLFSVYQGCVWGQDGCDDPTLAEDNITEEIDGLNNELNTIDQDFSNDNYASAYYVQGSINYEMREYIEPQEVEIDRAEAAVDEAYNGPDGVEAWYYRMEQRHQDEVAIGEYVDGCDVDWDCYDYNNSLDDYYEAYGYYSEQKKILSLMYTRTGQETDKDGDGISDGEQDTANISLASRMEMLDRYKTLCGTDLQSTSCTDGLIITKEDQKGDIQTVSLALSRGVTRRGGLDIGSKFTFKFLDADNPDPDAPLRTDYLDIDMKGVYLDGSYFRLWAREDSNGNSELNANISLNLYAKEINIATCGSICEVPGMEQAKADSTLYLDNFLLNLNLGHGDMQAVKFSSTSDGNFILELETPKSPLGEDGQPIYAGAQETYEAFYNESQKSYLYVGNIQLGTDPSKNLGSITIDGLRATYLKVTSHDL